MKINALFFALYRERVGNATRAFEMGEGATVQDLVKEVLRAYPSFSPVPDQVVVAVNCEYVDHSHPLTEGDEAAFIPPVSGGARC